MKFEIKVTVPEVKIDLKCPKCGHIFQEKIREIKPGRIKTCPHCGVTIEYKGDDLSKVQTELDKLKKIGH